MAQGETVEHNTKYAYLDSRTGKKVYVSRDCGQCPEPAVYGRGGRWFCLSCWVKEWPLMRPPMNDLQEQIDAARKRVAAWPKWVLERCYFACLAPSTPPTRPLK